MVTLTRANGIDNFVGLGLTWWQASHSSPAKIHSCEAYDTATETPCNLASKDPLSPESAVASFLHHIRTSSVILNGHAVLEVLTCKMKSIRRACCWNPYQCC